MEENENPSTKFTVPDSPCPEIQREESDELSDSIDHIEPVELSKRSLEALPTKTRPARFRETLQEVERHATPLGIFRESRKPQKYSRYVTQMSHISDAEPSTYE